MFVYLEKLLQRAWNYFHESAVNLKPAGGKGMNKYECDENSEFMELVEIG